MIVIKKITVVAAGAHGGAWKVAFADFMTALMAFFMVMWLTSQTEETKASLAEYFSTPSIIEYNFANYGVELTLEKLFLDLINEPLKTFSSFVTPVDRTPDVMALGHKKIIMHHLADQLGDVASNVTVNQDVIEFEIPDHYLFVPGSAQPGGDFVSVMQRVQGITSGLEESYVDITSSLFVESLRSESPRKTKFVAEARADFLTSKVKSSLEHGTVEVRGHIVTGNVRKMPRVGRPAGKIKFVITRKSFIENGGVSGESFGEAGADMTAYEKFVDQLSKRKAKKKSR